ncbi:MAG: extracellular solute-binding protein [Alphaproteobacteria bacterium]|nr:extracellular solute-binding protein [Alphaproteobacteria bacterium]
MTKLTSTQELVRAATVSRRRLLKSAVAIGAVGFSAPLTVQNAFSSSGELNFEGWAGYDDLKKTVFPAFEKATGIKTNFKEVDNQDTMFADAKLAVQTGAVDVMEPTLDRLPGWVSNDLIQPWDVKKLALDNYLDGVPGGKPGDAGEIKGQRYFVPSVWGTEALTFNSKTIKGDYGSIGLADLWDDKMAGKICIRAHSSLAAMGRVLDAAGKLPKPWLDGYKDEATMKQLWDIALAEAVKHKKNVAQFWGGENEAQAGFKTNGAELGLTWDSTGYNLRNDGYGFIAPKEGAFAWSQGYYLLKGAKNAEQAHAFAKWISTAEGSAAWASAFSANPVGKGGIEKMSPDVAKFYNAAYPGDALKKLWWWPAQEAWFIKLRGEYADKWKAA